MAEGLFRPGELPVPHVDADTLCASLVRVLPRTLLRLDLAPADQIYDLDRNETLPDGSEKWYRHFSPEDLARVGDPEFAMGMVRHEFSALVKAGASFPREVPLDGGGSGFAVDGAGHVLTNYHLVIPEVEHHGREAGVLGQEVRCSSLRAQVAERVDGRWRWREASAVWLVSHPPTARALHPVGKRSELREDTALLRVEPAPSASLTLSSREVLEGERVWMAGFPLRTARSPASLAHHRYTDADGSLRVSHGVVLPGGDADYFSTDLDGSMGNSGSPVFDALGQVVGLFSRASGPAIRNAIEYGHARRVHVRASLARRGLSL